MSLNDIRVAMLVANGFEQSEMLEPKKALEEAGAEVVIVSPEIETVRGWTKGNWGNEYPIDLGLDQANPADFDALVLPGGVMNPDTLRITENAASFIKHFVDEKKPIGSICHGPWTLINADGVKGRNMTSWPSLQVDLANAGANWMDEEVVVDENLVTSRKPDDLPAFNRELIKLFEKIDR